MKGRECPTTVGIRAPVGEAAGNISSRRATAQPCQKTISLCWISFAPENGLLLALSIKGIDVTAQSVRKAEERAAPSFHVSRLPTHPDRAEPSEPPAQPAARAGAGTAVRTERTVRTDLRAARGGSPGSAAPSSSRPGRLGSARFAGIAGPAPPPGQPHAPADLRGK